MKGNETLKKCSSQTNRRHSRPRQVIRVRQYRRSDFAELLLWKDKGRGKMQPVIPEDIAAFYGSLKCHAFCVN